MSQRANYMHPFLEESGPGKSSKGNARVWRCKRLLTLNLHHLWIILGQYYIPTQPTQKHTLCPYQYTEHQKQKLPSIFFSLLYKVHMTMYMRFDYKKKADIFTAVPEAMLPCECWTFNPRPWATWERPFSYFTYIFCYWGQMELKVTLHSSEMTFDYLEKENSFSKYVDSLFTQE